jgi:type I restriction enzyme S subunit
MTNHWAEYKLGEICSIKGRIGWRGYTREDLRLTGPVVIGAGDISSDQKLDLSNPTYISREKFEESPEIKIHRNDILIVKVGNTIGKVAIVKEDIGEACINPNTVLVKDCKINPYYVYYYLIGPEGQHFLKSNSSASAQPAINQSTLRELPIKAPKDLRQIDAIAEVLSSLDDKIELNNQINQELEALAQALFKHWFIDFEFPISAADAASMGKPNLEGKPYKSSGGEMVESELGEIPKGWIIETIGKLGRVVTGKTPSSKNLNHFGNAIPFVTPTDFKDYFKIIIGAKRGLSTEGANQFKKSILPRNSLIVTCIGSDMGKVAINKVECVTNQQINSVVFSSESKIGCEYSYYYLNHIYDDLRNMATGGSTMPIINKSEFERIRIPIPNAMEIELFTRMAQSIDSQMETNASENSNLAVIRDLLLPKLISGDLEVI